MKQVLFVLLIALTFCVPSLAQQIEQPLTAKNVREQVITHVGYTASYNSDFLIPNWVAWELTKEEAHGTIGRSQQFVPDPMVKGKSASTYDYSRSGYDRGHMAPAADMKWSRWTKVFISRISAHRIMRSMQDSGSSLKAVAVDGLSSMARFGSVVAPLFLNTRELLAKIRLLSHLASSRWYVQNEEDSIKQSASFSRMALARVPSGIMQ